jgi:hypothetical protein
MKNSLRTSGDILAATNESWSALSGDEDALYKVSTGNANPRRRARKKK